MIFILHYLLFNAGLPAVIILITLFLQTYSDASLGQIGTLLMALPFMSILIKPLFCALADRHRAHRRYLMGALACMALGYGSLAVAPFYPKFIQEHGQLVWVLDIVGIMLGYSAFGITWSLGDALAVNGAQMAGVTWGHYRVWGVVSWGIVGIIIGQINEIPLLPRYVPAFLVLVTCLLVEIVLLALWPNKYFVMNGTLCESQQKRQCTGSSSATLSDHMRAVSLNESGAAQLGSDESLHRDSMADLESQWPVNGAGSLRGSITAGGTLGPKTIGAVANILMEDLGGTLKSSLKLGAKPKRMGLGEMLEQHYREAEQAGTDGTDGARQQATGGSASFSSGTLRRIVGLSPSQQQNSVNESTQSTSLGKEAALRAVRLMAKQAAPSQKEAAALSLDQFAPVELVPSKELEQEVDFRRGPEDFLEDQKPTPKSAEDLQLVLLKLIVMRDKTIGKYLVLFTLFGFLLTCHLSYFYLHLERLCREKGHDFSSVTGGMLATHSISEILSFLAVPYYIPRVGRIGGLMTCALAYFVRFAYYGTYFVENSPYTGVPFEFCHGIAYGIVYSLITDIAIECVNQVDEFMPELIERGLIDPNMPAGELKSPLRATMQGIFSGAFDGLGNGLGALFGGLFLDSYPFTSLWKFCALVCVAMMIIYPLTEWRVLLKCPRQEASIDDEKATRTTRTTTKQQAGMVARAS